MYIDLFQERIPNILCNLALHVTSSQRPSERVSLIRSYYYFTTFLLENLHHLENYGGSYVIREIIYRVLYFIEENQKVTNEDNSRITYICFEILDTLCERIGSHLYVSKELSKHLCFIVSKLIHFTMKETTSVLALKLLQYLIADSTQNEDYLEYITAVSLLQDFPSQPKFSQLNDRLIAIKRDRTSNCFEEVCFYCLISFNSIPWDLFWSYSPYLWGCFQQWNESLLNDRSTCIKNNSKNFAYHNFSWYTPRHHHN